MDSCFFCRRNLAVVFVLLAAGCRTPVALHRNTVQLGDTVADIQQQQVLDNLAKFVSDPYAIPSFALANSGTSDITDSCNGGLSISWIATGFDSLGLNFMGNRDKQNNWTVTPITDPRKLELMRCAYQRAVAQCSSSGESVCCPNCQQRFNEFYTGKPAPPVSEGAASVELPPPTAASTISAEPASAFCNLCPTDTANVTADCLKTGRCWFHYGCKNSVPKCCGYVGHYCDTYVWVCPGPDRDELAKLTLAILDYAVNDAVQLPTKEVTAYLDRNGFPTTPSDASFVVRANIGADEQNMSLLESEKKQAKATLDRVNAMQRQSYRSLQAVPEKELSEAREIESAPPLRPLPQQRTPVPNTNLLYLQQQLNTVR